MATQVSHKRWHLELPSKWMTMVSGYQEAGNTSGSSRLIDRTGKRRSAHGLEEEKVECMEQENADSVAV
jgi:hypothetical protein